MPLADLSEEARRLVAYVSAASGTHLRVPALEEYLESLESIVSAARKLDACFDDNLLVFGQGVDQKRARKGLRDALRRFDGDDADDHPARGSSDEGMKK